MRQFLRGAVLLALLAMPGFGVTFNLNCVLSNGACTAFPESFGSVTLVDRAGGVDVTVVTALGGKYKDLFLNISGTPTFTSAAEFSSNGFVLNPYSGLYDVGTNTSPSKGFDGTSGSTFSILGTGFTAASFSQLDSLGLTYVGIHLQQIDCTSTSCTSGGGSIKVGGWLMPEPPSDDPGVPEPSTYAIVGGGLAAVYWMRRKRAQA
jgi:PEP-CTERM motif